MPGGRSRVLLCFRERLRLFSLWSEDVKIQSNMQPCTTRFFGLDLNAPSGFIVGVGSGSENFKVKRCQELYFRESNAALIWLSVPVCVCVCMRVCTMLRILWQPSWQPSLFPLFKTQNMGYLLRHHFPTASSTERHDMIMLCSSKVSSLQLWKSWKIMLICQRFDRCSFLDWDGY